MSSGEFQQGKTATGSTPRIVGMRVVPVAASDSMLLSLSGAHAPLITRNIVVLTDSEGRTGLGETPGGERVLQIPVEPGVRCLVYLAHSRRR